MFRGIRSRMVAAASIGSGSVSFGIAQCDGQRSVLLASEHRVLPLEDRAPEQAAAALKQQLIEAAKKTITAISTSGRPSAVDALYCIIRSPWTRTQTCRTATVLDAEMRITDGLISDLAKQSLSNVKDRERFFDAAVAQISLNGYPTTKPEGKHAHQAAVTALISSCEPVMRAAALDALGSVFPSQQVIMRSGTRALLEALQEARPGIVDCLILDVTEEGTAAVVVRNGAPENELLIPEGVRSILTKASSGGTPEETRQALRMIARDECSEATCTAVQAACAAIEPELAHVFGEHFAKLSTPQRLPTTTLLVAHPDLSPWLSRFFSRIDFTQFTLSAQPFEVVPITGEGLGKVTSASDGDVDIDLSIALTLINKEAFSV